MIAGKYEGSYFMGEGGESRLVDGGSDTNRPNIVPSNNSSVVSLDAYQTAADAIGASSQDEGAVAVASLGNKYVLQRNRE